MEHTEAAATIVLPDTVIDCGDDAPRDALSRKQLAFAIGFVLLVALILRILLAVHFDSTDWPDEVYQTREPAHHLAYGNWVVTWEYKQGLRSWVLPAFLSLVMRATDWMGQGSDGYLLGIKIVLSLLSLPSIVFSALWAYRVSGYRAAIITGVLSAFWYELIYYAPKSLNEVVAGYLLLPGLYLGAFELRTIRSEKIRLVLAGLCCGLAVALRMQLAPVVLLAAIYFCRDRWRQRLPIVAASILLPLLIFGVVDAFTWSYPFHSYIANFRFNISSSSAFGTAPAGWYATELLSHFGPLLALAILGGCRSPILGWLTLLLLISHSLVPHKEYRFLTPVLPILVTLAGIGLAEVCDSLSARFHFDGTRTRLTAAACALCILLSVWMGIRFPRWNWGVANAIAFRELSRDDSVCGVAMVTNSWSTYGGYTYLHRDVPIYLLSESRDVAALGQRFNAFVTTIVLPLHFHQFQLWKCQGGVCVYRRLGGCSFDPKAELNRFSGRAPQ